MLKTALGEASLTQLIMLYHQQVSDYFAQMAACLATSPLTMGQAQHVARLAHQLRGESVSVGGDQLAEQAKTLEQLANTRQHAPGQLDEVFRALRETATHTHAALENWRRDHLPD